MVIFSQGCSDGARHALVVDEITIELTGAEGGAMTPARPQGVKAEGFERHIDISWTHGDEEHLRNYVIYRSTDGGEFQPIGIQEPGLNRYTDFLGKPGQVAFYKVAAVDEGGRVSSMSAVARGTTHPMSDEELLTMLQEECFRYYWESAGPHSGMARENIPGDDRIVATGATGFGIMALVAGIDRGFITRTAGIERLRKITDFLARAPRYHGAWSHFMDDATGASLPVFSTFDDGGDLVETAFLMQGLLSVRQYLRDDQGLEKKLRDSITKLWETVEWDWYRRSEESYALLWHWSPRWSWYIDNRLTGFNEVMIVYFAGERIAHAFGASKLVLFRMGERRPAACRKCARAIGSAVYRFVGEPRAWRQFHKRRYIPWNPTGCGCKDWWSAVLRAVFVHGLRPAKTP